MRHTDPRAPMRSIFTNRPLPPLHLGTLWQQVLEHAPWEPRSHASLTLHSNSIYLVGGTNYETMFHDVWVTDDLSKEEIGCCTRLVAPLTCENQVTGPP